MTFWSNDLFDATNASPKDILKAAGDEWRTAPRFCHTAFRRRSWTIALCWALLYTTYHKHGTTVYLRRHRLNQTYPVLINPPKSDIPEFLQRKRYVPGEAGLATGVLGPGFHRIIEGRPGRFVENEWVCGTPAEFREKVIKVLAMDHVKRISEPFSTADGSRHFTNS